MSSLGAEWASRWILLVFWYVSWPIEASEYRFRGKVLVLYTWDQVFWPGHLNLNKLYCTSWRRPQCLLKNIIQKSTKKYPNIFFLIFYGLIYQWAAVMLPIYFTMDVIEVHQMPQVFIVYNWSKPDAGSYSENIFLLAELKHMSLFSAPPAIWFHNKISWNRRLGCCACQQIKEWESLNEISPLRLDHP